MGEGLHLKRWGFQCGRNVWACILVGRDPLKVMHSVLLDHSLARFSDNSTGSLPFKVGSTNKDEDGQREGWYRIWNSGDDTLNPSLPGAHSWRTDTSSVRQSMTCIQKPRYLLHWELSPYSSHTEVDKAHCQKEEKWLLPPPNLLYKLYTFKLCTSQLSFF